MNVREELPRPRLRSTRDCADIGLLNEPVGMDDGRFLVFRRAGEPVKIVEHGEVTCDGRDDTLPPLPVRAGGEIDDSESGSEVSGVVDIG